MNKQNILGELARFDVFCGLAEEDISCLLDYFEAKPAEFEPGNLIMDNWVISKYFCVIISGTAEIEQTDFNGNRSCVLPLLSGDVCALGASAGNGIACCRIVAKTHCSILLMRADKMQNMIPEMNKIFSVFMTNLMRQIDNRMKAILCKLTIVSQRTIREKVFNYLYMLTNQQQSSRVVSPLSRQEMADYLVVERSALSKELSKMKAEGIIEYNRNRFTILKDF